MNKINLDKLCNFAITTHKNEFINKIFDIDDFINNIKQNQSLNEKGIFLKHNFIEITKLIFDIEYNHLVLINPICFNLSGNIQWFNFLNAILTVLNDNYLHETNLIKKNILESADKTFREKIIFTEEFNDKIINKVCVLTNIMLILLRNNKKTKFFNIKNKSNISKIVVIVNNDKEYFSVINWKQKYYDLNSEFINYLMNKYNTNEPNDTNNIDTVNTIESSDNSKINDNSKEYFVDVVNKKKKSIISTKSPKSTKSDITNSLDFNNDNIIDNLNKDCLVNNNEKNKVIYEELNADENHALYISEVCENNNKTIINNISAEKKKKKNDKNIFIINKENIKKSTKTKNDIKDNINDTDDLNNIDDNTNDNESSVFNKTEKLTKKDIDMINNNVKISMVLETIQAYAIKLGIPIFEGSTKTGKPKNKTKSELILQIKEFATNFSK
jgi:hypothetical protein